MKKIFSIISIVIILGLLTIYGAFSPYNYLTAKQDIALHKLKKVCINLHPLTAVNEKSLGTKYGLEVINIETKRETKPVYYLGIKTYNRLMLESFVKINGDKLYKSYRKELDSLYRTTFIY